MGNIIDGALDVAIKDRIKNTDQAYRYMRQVASKFTTPEIEEIHNLMIQGELRIDTLNNLLQVKGMAPLPRSEEELKAYFAKQKEGEDKRLAEIKARFRHGRAVQKPNRGSPPSRG